ncbi:MAG: NADH:flavin oxidoreductase/NADH oxidase [Phyllobacterium sp.]
MNGIQTDLLTPLTIRGRTLRNRIAISPMCTYSATDGVAEDFHLVHYGRFGLGGVGLVMIEATAILPEGRISHGDLGLWSDDQIGPLSRIVKVLRQQGAAVGIQLCHAGRKANRQRPWQGNGPLSQEDHARGERDWALKAPSPIAMADGYRVPDEISLQEMDGVRRAFVGAAGRALEADFDIIELHAAHGFLLHSFMSPLTNQRNDLYSGAFEDRHRYVFEVVKDVRAAWPQDRPLFVRASMQDGAEGGRDFSETVALGKELKQRGVDVVDCSSGGIGGHSASTARQGPSGFGFQIPFAQRLRQESGIATMAVGLITDPVLADTVIREGHADIVAIGRQALVEPNWPLLAEAALRGPGADGKRFSSWPTQYGWWLEGRRPVVEQLGADAWGRRTV